jgi:hypothetical protein
MSLADVLLGGEGFIITAHPTSVKKDESSVSKVKNMDAMTDRLKFLIRDSKHDLHYKTLHSLSTGLDKNHVQKTTEDSTRSAFDHVDGQHDGIRNRSAKARDDPHGPRNEALKTMRPLSLSLTLDAYVVTADVPAQEG